MKDSSLHAQSPSPGSAACELSASTYTSTFVAVIHIWKSSYILHLRLRNAEICLLLRLWLDYLFKLKIKNVILDNFANDIKVTRLWNYFHDAGTSLKSLLSLSWSRNSLLYKMRLFITLLAKARYCALK
jgi:hypothetical protein